MNLDALADPVVLTQALIRCPSVTPDEAGALVLLEALLSAHGFVTRRVDRGGVCNLYARFGTNGPVLGLNGHIDVVPVGDRSSWDFDPFGAEIHDGLIYGRGACDMKSGVAVFVTAAIAFSKLDFNGSLVLLITGDEEGPGVDGTRALLEDLVTHDERLDHALVAEPTAPNFVGEAIKVGRRGSLSTHVTVTGKQGHVAYPERARNPNRVLIDFLHDLQNLALDTGFEDFEPSHLEIVTIDVGNKAVNVIPAQARAAFNIRFNPTHSGASLMSLIKEQARIHTDEGVDFNLDFTLSGEAFLTKPGPFRAIVDECVHEVTGHIPKASTTGGTSDARFIKDYCEVVECGLVGKTMHASNEHVKIDDIKSLYKIYMRIFQDYFGK